MAGHFSREELYELVWATPLSKFEVGEPGAIKRTMANAKVGL